MEELFFNKIVGCFLQAPWQDFFFVRCRVFELALFVDIVCMNEMLAHVSLQTSGCFFFCYACFLYFS